MWIICVYLLSTLVAAHDGENHLPERLSFLEEPKDTYVLSLVDEVPLKCEAYSPVGGVKYTWLKKENDGTLKTVVSTKNSFFRNGSLIFNSTSLLAGTENNGHYQCKVHNSEGLLYSREAKLTYAVSYPSFPGPLQPIQAIEYSGMVIECPLTGFSIRDINYKWFHNSVEVTSKTPNVFVSLDGRLYFSEVRRAQSGTYQCQTSFRAIEGNGIYVGNSSQNSQTSQDIQVKVKANVPHEEPFNILANFPQVFPRQPKVGLTLQLECIAFGNLPLQYSWLFEGQPLTDVTSLTNRTALADGNRRLIVSDLWITDEGQYTCIATNNNQTQNRSIQVQVGGLPIFSLKPSDGEARSNSFFKLNCLSYGPLSPEVVWLKDGVQIGNKTSQMYVDAETVILFSPTKGRDDGLYQCAATNLYGTVYATAKVTVKNVKPVASGEKLKLTSFILVPMLLIIIIIIIIYSYK